jgi:sulfur-carrier protein adenylyltransferase/sulfurtransferase
MNRYSRHIILSEIGQEGQNKLSQGRVLVIGAGGLGCPVLQYLVAAGVGTIGVVDFDVVEVSNLQRQILYGTSSLGINKALAAKTRLEDLNPTIKINAYPEKLTSSNTLELFRSYDIIVDGTDNFATRYLINDAAVITNKPIVYGAIYKFEGQVSVFNYQNGPSYRCLFPNPPEEGAIANCSEIGVLGVLPGIIGTMQANEVIKIILGFDGVLSGKLLCYNAKTTQVSTLKISKSKSEFENITVLKDTYSQRSCVAQVKEISIEDALIKDQIQFIDVREDTEQPQLDLPNCIHIPLFTLEQNLSKINLNNTNILFCQYGISSKTAVEILQKHNITNCYSLKGGAISIQKHLKIDLQ